MSFFPLQPTLPPLEDIVDPPSVVAEIPVESVLQSPPPPMTESSHVQVPPSKTTCGPFPFPSKEVNKTSVLSQPLEPDNELEVAMRSILPVEETPFPEDVGLSPPYTQGTDAVLVPDLDQPIPDPVPTISSCDILAEAVDVIGYPVTKDYQAEPLPSTGPADPRYFFMVLLASRPIHPHRLVSYARLGSVPCRDCVLTVTGYASPQ